MTNGPTTISTYILPLFDLPFGPLCGSDKGRFSDKRYNDKDKGRLQTNVPKGRFYLSPIGNRDSRMFADFRYNGNGTPTDTS